MKPKFEMPNNRDECIAIRQTMICRANEALKGIAYQKIQINKELIDLQIRELSGESLLSEINAVHKKELQCRMEELCLIKQKENLEKSIENFV
jgi:hypothetical protein